MNVEFVALGKPMIVGKGSESRSNSEITTTMADLIDTGESNFLVAAFYKFVTLADFEELQAPLQKVCISNKVMGTILLAHEGINGTISGPKNGIRTVLKWLGDKPEFADLDVKFSWTDDPPFYRMKVRLKKEIVTLGVDEVDAANQAGTYVKPQDWNDLIRQPDVVIIDTRNDYEVAIGSFEGAQNPQTTSFRELPEWVDDKLAAKPETKIAMFCTGGIRCEKSTALLKSKGYENVYHLQGGILRYLEETPEEESLWHGECFVFDQRVSVKHGLEVGSYDMCHACRMPINETELASEHYIKGISCPHCFDKQDDRQRARFQERQKQVDLANSRSESHIATDISAAKAAKRAEKEDQRKRSLKKA